MFDAAIFGSGRLFAMLPQEWIPDAAALNREFMLPIAHPVGWVSGYLPINAAIRAGFRVIGLAEWASPAMAAASILLIWSIARHLWPDDRGAASVAVIMLAGSGQFLLTGMTTYAMTAHLLLNLIWLRLFLQGRSWADALAVVTGFMATGLHQPVFHPLFAGPLIALLAWRREFRRFVSFGIAYLAICVFWYLWPQWLAGQITARAGVSSEHLQSLSYLDRLTEVFHVDWSNLFLQIYNLLALVVWQHLLLVPLCVIALRRIPRDSLMLALAAGIIAPIVVMGLILPYQGFGYGYRYMHGVLGSLALLAALGWHHLAGERERWLPLLAWTTVLGIAVLLPFQAWRPVASFSELIAAKQRLAASGTALFLLDSRGDLRTELLAYNGPDLTEKPIIVLVDRISDPVEFAGRHCRSGVVVGVGTRKFYDSGIANLDTTGSYIETETIGTLKRSLLAAGCTLRSID